MRHFKLGSTKQTGERGHLIPAAVVVQQQEDWYRKVGVRRCEGPAIGAGAQKAGQGS
jgi:hypothetical protein